MRQRRFDDPEGRIDIRLHRRVEILARDIEDRRPGLLPRRVADQDIQSTQTAHGIGHQLLAKASSRRSPGSAIALRPSALISSITSFASGSSDGK